MQRCGAIEEWLLAFAGRDGALIGAIALYKAAMAPSAPGIRTPC
jgi:hypothetical protein